MKNEDVIFLIVCFITILIFNWVEFTKISGKLNTIDTKQNQIIILLSKDYPELQINSIKEKKRIPKKEKDN